MSNVELENRLKNIETRLSNIETVLRIIPKAAVNQQTSFEDASFNEPPLKPSAPPVYPAIEKKPGNWLGIIGIICFIFAAGFIIKLSIDSGWLTPVRQLGIATIFGIALIIMGFILMRSDREYAGLLPAAGIIVLYLTVFAAHQYYALISFGAAITIISVISGLCLYLYTLIKHDLYAIIAAVFAYLSPVILQLNVEAVFSIYYFLVCSIVFATLSIWVQSRLFAILAAYLAILVTAYVGLNLNQDHLIAFVLPLHFLIFATGTYLYTRQNKQELSVKEAWSFFPVLTIFYATEYYYINNIYPGLAPWISLGFAAVLIGIYFAAKKLSPTKILNSQAVIIAFTTLVLFHSIYLELLPIEFRPWLFVLFVLLLAFIPKNVSSTKNMNTFRIPLLAVCAIVVIEYVSMIFHLMEDGNLSWTIVSLASLASIWLILIMNKINFIKEEYKFSVLGAAHLLAITAFYQLTNSYGSLAVSASWLCYALFVVVFAFMSKDKVMAKSALVVLGFAAGKALLYDVSSAPTIVRILCLLLTGAVLYGSGFMMRKISGWDREYQK